MISEVEIDEALLANIAKEWRKIAFVVGMTMMQIDKKQRAGLDDVYFAKRVVGLVEKGLIDYQGELDQMRECEIRLAVKTE
jgi:hypothetical protein